MPVAMNILTRAMKDAGASMSGPRPNSALRLSSYAGSAAMIVAALVLGLLLKQTLGFNNIALVFLIAIFASAIAYGLVPSLCASLVSILALNFFFIPPLYTLTVADPQNVVSLIFFTIVAAVSSQLAARLRDQALTARERAATTENLYLFSRKLAGVFTLDDLLWVAAFQFAQMLKARVVILLPDGDSVSVRAGYPPEDMLDDADLAAAKWAWSHATSAGRGSDILAGAKWLFLPVRTGRGMIGVVGLDSDREGPLLTPESQRLFDALADQMALAIERIHLAEDVDRTRIASETERLRAALLTSISHDLRTPLASILGSASSLSSYRKSMDDAAQDELILTIQDEAQRLNRFIANLLDMTKLESGAIEIRNATADVADVVGSVLRRASAVLARHRTEIDLVPDMPPAKADPVLLEQVLFNLLDNAAKYTAAGTNVRIEGRVLGDTVQLRVMDEGSGIPDGDLERIFDKFYRVHAADKKRAGTGLGLAIARGFVEAMGGAIRAGNRTDRMGAVFTVTLPVAAKHELSEYIS
jgi:two-component system sensor histidine kinase KdpD